METTKIVAYDLDHTLANLLGHLPVDSNHLYLSDHHGKFLNC